MTGAGGQLGKAIASLAPGATLLTRRDLDVAQVQAVMDTVERHRPEVVIHAAAWTSVDGAEADAGAARAVNVGGTEAVARAATQVNALLVYPSTDYVFSGAEARPHREDDPTEPLSVYGETKLLGEEAAASSPRHLVVRTSWVFGDGRNFVRTVLDRARRGQEIAVVSDQIGLPTHAVDLARGILDLVKRECTGTFHLAGGGEPCSWADLAEGALDVGARFGIVPVRPTVHRLTTAEYQARQRGPVAPRPRYSVLDCGKAATLGVALRPWREALQEYVRYLE